VTESQWATLRHFNKSEFNEPEKMSYPLLVKLDSARDVAGIPFTITSSYREDPDPTDDENSAHYEGLAVDIRAPDGYSRFRIVNALLAAGFLRIGVYDRHVHADVDPNKPAPVLWTGVSQ